MPLIMPALGLTLMLSLVLGNFGIVLRERMQVFVLLVPFLALGLHKEADATPHEVDLDKIAGTQTVIQKETVLIGSHPFHIG